MGERIMKVEKNNGGSAFPRNHVPGTITTDGAGMQRFTPFLPAQNGMTLRDYFAARVGTGDLMSIRNQADRETLVGRPQPDDWPNGLDSIKFNLEVEASLRFFYADVMIEARNRE